MIQKVEIPGLEGRSALGFLASLGLTRALSFVGVDPVYLSFAPDSACAVLHSPLASTGEIADRLEQLVAMSPKAAVVGVNEGFPLKAGRNADPMRRSRDEFREFVAEMAELDQAAAAEWMPCLFTDLAVDAQGRADLTPFCAPSGKQNLRTFFETSLSEVRVRQSRLREALESWERVERFTGEYLDHRAINSAADDANGRPGAEHGVPGATWLATMAIPMLRLAGDGNRIRATLWHRLARRSVMIWPLWEPPLDRLAIQALIEHPSLVPTDDRPAVRTNAWPALGIFAVYGAERQRIQGRNFAGVLAPCTVIAEQG